MERIGTYYNTNDETGGVLETSRGRAHKEDTAVFIHFLKNPNTLYTGEDIQRLVLPGKPRTNAGRALSNLTESHCLIKHDIYRVSSWGKQCHTWSLNKEILKERQLPLAFGITLKCLICGESATSYAPICHKCIEKYNT